MKNITSFLLPFAFFISPCFSQSVVFDPQHVMAVMANGAARSAAESSHNHYLNNINTNLDNINTNVGSVVLAQTIIYNALSDVNSALKNGMAVKNLSVEISDMVSYLNQCLAMAKSEPYLLLFASGIESEMTAKSIALLSDVSAYILNDGGNVLADYNSRDQLLRKVTQQVQILNSLAYGAWRAMYWAKERGIIASLNPFQSYINKDRQFVANIIQKAKYLQ
jgi:hypothetical protein